MSDPTPPAPPPDPPRDPPEDPPKHIDPNDAAFALRLMEPASDSFRLYMDALIDSLLNNPDYAEEDRKQLFNLPEVKKLSDHDALRMFLCVLRRTPLIPDAAFIKAGMTPGRCLSRYNKNSLGIAERGNHQIPVDLEECVKDDRFTANASTFVDAAVEAGLLSRNTDNVRCQDIELTQRGLDMIMRYSRNYLALQLRLSGALSEMNKKSRKKKKGGD